MATDRPGVAALWGSCRYAPHERIYEHDDWAMVRWC